jgi:hypothetical protein
MTMLSLSLLGIGFMFATFIPTAAPLFTTYAGTLLGITTAYLGSHILAEHVSNLADQSRSSTG